MAWQMFWGSAYLLSSISLHPSWRALACKWTLAIIQRLLLLSLAKIVCMLINHQIVEAMSDMLAEWSHVHWGESLGTLPSCGHGISVLVN
jgi:hypothetical protein